MTIQTTRWSPDTCKCVIEYEWDDKVPQREREHNVARIVRVCKAHEALDAGIEAKIMESTKNIFDNVLSENRLKNHTLRKVLEVQPELADFIEPELGRRIDAKSFLSTSKTNLTASKAASLYGVGLTLKEDVEYEWRWIEDKQESIDKPRTLEINFKQPRVYEVISPERLISTAKTFTPNLQQELDKEFKGRVKVKQS
jgi:hypothetical protein